MKFTCNDGGRVAAGYKGSAGDCVVRAVVIATERSYSTVYAELSTLAGQERKTKGATARNGIHTSRKWFKDYMRGLGWEFVATMGIGTGCRVHLVDGELPMGRLIVSVSKHYTCVIDGVIHDTFDPQRAAHVIESDNGRALKPGEWRNVNGICRIAHRCVYGFWRKS